MKTSHLYLFGVAAVTIGFIASAPGAAASTSAAPLQAEAEALPASPAPDAALSAEQQADFDSWPSEQQAQYELWPVETRGYYWTLTPPRQMLFWRLSDEDKIALTAMTGPERDTAWGQIESRATTPPSD